MKAELANADNKTKEIFPRIMDMPVSTFYFID